MRRSVIALLLTAPVLAAAPPAPADASPAVKRAGNQIHRDWMVGTNLRRSHGCIRLPKPFSARLWDFGRIGTRVRVVSG